MISSTMLDVLDVAHSSVRVEMRMKEKQQQQQPQTSLKRILVVKNNNELEANIFPKFFIDFASTPIKLAPKTSTPIKLLHNK
jgi:hypothetical protein